MSSIKNEHFYEKLSINIFKSTKSLIVCLNSLNVQINQKFSKEH